MTTTMSLALTASPGLTRISRTPPSEIFSPKSGRVMSTGMFRVSVGRFFEASLTMLCTNGIGLFGVDAQILDRLSHDGRLDLIAASELRQCGHRDAFGIDL